MSDQKPESVVATINKTLQEGKVTQLAPNRVMHAEHAHQTFVASPETGTPFEAILDSKYWAHYSVNPNMEMKPGDQILVKPEDGSYFAELLVRSKYRGGVSVAVLRHVKLDSATEAAGDQEYTVKFSGPVMKWRVIRNLDKRELSQGHATRDEAEQWLREHKKAIAA